VIGKCLIIILIHHIIYELSSFSILRAKFLVSNC